MKKNLLAFLIEDKELKMLELETDLDFLEYWMTTVLGDYYMQRYCVVN